MANKKAFEMQFNWIFVLFAGAMIMLFFTTVIVRQKNVSEASLKIEVLKDIGAIVAGAGVSTDTTSLVGIPNSDIEISCNRISVGGVPKPYQSSIFFAPGLIKGSKLVWQTLGFDVPYRATNLLFMTSEKLRYIIIGNTNFAKEINKSLSLHLNKEFYSAMPTIKNSNNYRVRFVFFEDMFGVPEALGKMPDSDVTAVKINGDSEKGTIEFHQKYKSSWASKGTSYYITTPSLIGAIYSDSIEEYKCNMRNAFSKLKLVTKVYSERTQKLKASLPARQIECRQFYDKALTYIETIEASSEFSQQNINSIMIAAKSLADMNKELQKNSCPLVY